VVIPLNRMGEYTDGIERINVELSIKNKLQLAEQLRQYLANEHLPIEKSDDATGDTVDRAEILGDRPQQALALVEQVAARWRFILANLDAPLAGVRGKLDELGLDHLSATLDQRIGAQPDALLFDVVQDHSIRVSWKQELRAPLRQIFNGAAYKCILDECTAIHQRVLRSRVFVALHMHAGDGNVHTNLPVNSDDYAMLQDAHQAVERIMKLARSLDGVISGEHGIGITKLEFLLDSEISEFRDYKLRVDPEGRFNKGKLLNREGAFADLRNAYTPSFGLMGHESLIMQQSDIGEIAASIKDCLRCGKCKPVCTTHVPQANLLYSPRDKILATSALIEAFLYEEQTRRGVSIRHWEEFEDVSDHCTVCHKCVTPCPVNIDFGDVSMNMRNLLRKMDKRSFKPANRAAMFFLNATDPTTINATRKLMVDWGYKAQRLGNQMLRGLAKPQVEAPPPTTGKAPVREQVIHFINKKMPGNLPKKTARALLDIEDDKVIPIIRNPKATNADTEAVFYFPGCGSERLFSQVGLATQAMLWEVGVQTVLPPGYLCCGYPQRGAGQYDKADKMVTDNRVLFHRMANTLNYLDINEYLMEKGVKLEGVSGTRYMYHDPCHTPMKMQDSLKTVNALVSTFDNVKIEKNERCCGESGTFAVSRPDIATQVRSRKEGEMEQGAARLRADGFDGQVKVLTSCPSCLQGLSRYNHDAGTTADYIVVEMARHLLGENWMPDYVARANNGGIERVLV